MKKNRFFCFLISLMIAVQPVLLSSSATDISTVSANIPVTGMDVSVTGGSHSIDAQVPLLGSNKMLKTTAAAFLYEVTSDTVLYVWNPDTRQEPASLVKIMTAMITLEKGNLSDVVTVTQSALDVIPPGTVNEQLLPGEQLTLEDLMYCMMVGGANDCAAVIAEHVCGSQEAFVKLMNERAAELGCTNTNFTNTHGLYDPDQYTSARDMVRIVREAIKDERFRVFFSTIQYIVPETNMSGKRASETTNYLITPGVSQVYYDPRVTGGRTGVADSGTRSLVSTASSNGLEYIGVVLNAVPTYGENKYSILRFGNYEESKTLYKIAFDNLQVLQVLNENEIITQCQVAGGNNDVVIGPDTSISTVLPAGVTVADLSYRYAVTGNGLSLPVVPGQKLSTIEVWYGSICVAQANLETKNYVYGADGSQDNSQQGQFSSEGLVKILIVLGIAACIVVLLAALLYLIRFINISRVRTKRRRRVAGRRRSR